MMKTEANMNYKKSNNYLIAEKNRNSDSEICLIPIGNKDKN